MVKGEVDIVEDWVMYHGELFGYDNLYVIDNYSRDGTYEKLIQLKNQYGIKVFRWANYKKKGDYMTLLLKTFGNNDIVFPIDIDEFIVYYNKQSNTISCDKSQIIQYISHLPKLPFYKMNYIWSKTLSETGYTRATVETKFGTYMDYGGHAKTFFHSELFKGKIDHGNHYMTDRYLLTQLCLVHFHERNLEQIKKKVYNNVVGLGHDPFNLSYLKYIQSKGTTVAGYHHISKQIQIIENTFKLPVSAITNEDISLEPFIETMVALSEHV